MACVDHMLVSALFVLTITTVRGQNGGRDSTPAPIGQNQINYCDYADRLPLDNPVICRVLKEEEGNNVVFANIRNCSSYYQCTGDKLHTRFCGAGTSFDSVSFSCLATEDAQCLSTCDNTTSSTIQPLTSHRGDQGGGAWQTPPVITPEPPEVTVFTGTPPLYCIRNLPCKPGRKVPDLEFECRRYFICNDEGTEWNVKPCPSRLRPMRYDAEQGKCAPADQVSCLPPCPKRTTAEPTTTMEETTLEPTTTTPVPTTPEPITTTPLPTTPTSEPTTIPTTTTPEPRTTTPEPTTTTPTPEPTTTTTVPTTTIPVPTTTTPEPTTTTPLPTTTTPEPTTIPTTTTPEPTTTTPEPTTMTSEPPTTTTPESTTTTPEPTTTTHEPTTTTPETTTPITTTPEPTTTTPEPTTTTPEPTTMTSEPPTTTTPESTTTTPEPTTTTHEPTTTPPEPTTTTHEPTTTTPETTTPITTTPEPTTTTPEPTTILTTLVQKVETTMPDFTSTLEATTVQPTVELSTSFIITTNLQMTTMTQYPESSVCNRLLPCKIGDTLPDPENCTSYYKCRIVPGSVQEDTEWNSVRCVSKNAFQQFDRNTNQCMDKDTGPVCAESCKVPSTVALGPEVTTVGESFSTSKVDTTEQPGTTAPSQSSAQSLDIDITTLVDRSGEHTTQSLMTTVVEDATEAETTVVEVIAMTSTTTADQTMSIGDKSSGNIIALTTPVASPETTEVTDKITQSPTQTTTTTIESASTVTELVTTQEPEIEQETSDLPTGTTAQDIFSTLSVTQSTDILLTSKQTIALDHETTALDGDVTEADTETVTDSEVTSQAYPESTIGEQISTSSTAIAQTTFESTTKESLKLTTEPVAITSKSQDATSDSGDQITTTFTASTDDFGQSTTPVQQPTTIELDEETTTISTSIPATGAPVMIRDHVLQFTSPTAYEGHPIKLTCSFKMIDSSMQNGIRWFLDDQPINIKQSKRFSLIDITVPGVRGAILTIDPAKASDSGRFSCEVTIRQTRLTSTADFELEVIGLPTVTLLPKTISVQLGASVTLACDYSDTNMFFAVTWYMNDNIVTNATGNITTESDRSFLQLTVDTRSTFRCTVENPAGKSSSEVTVVTVIKPNDLICAVDNDGRINWKDIPQEETAIVMCPPPLIGYAHRTCAAKTSYSDKSGEEDNGTVQNDIVLENPIWLDANYNDCTDPAFVNMLDDLKKMSDGIGVTSQATNTKVQHLRNLTSAPTLYPGDIKASVDIVKVIEDVHEIYPEAELTVDELKAVVQVISNLISEERQSDWNRLLSDSKTESTAGDVLVLVDAFTNIAAKDIDTNETIITDNMLLQIESFPKSMPQTVTFPKTKALPVSWMINQNDAITIEKDTLDNIPNAMLDGQSYKFSSVYYRNIESILPGKMEDSSEGDDGNTNIVEEEIINSRVLSLTLHGLKSNTKLDPNITINFSLTEPRENYTAICAYWKYSKNGSSWNAGMWDTEGCHVVSTSNGQVTCQCDHLTNFAILMSPSPLEGPHKYILSVISIVGCVVSIGCMVLTILIYASMWSHVKSHHAVVLINLCIALIVANVLFVAGVDKVDSPVLCTVMAALLHYFYLSAFFMMMVEGIELMLYTIYVFHVRRKRETATLIFLAWTLPAIIVGICLGVTKLEGYGNEKFCWLDVESGLLWAFVGPALLVILINCIIAVIVLRRLATSRVLGTVQKKKNKIRGALRNLLVIMPVMGIAWLFGVFTVNGDDPDDDLHNVIFQYIFVVFNSLQGLFIFIFHALCNKKKEHSNQSSYKTNRSRLKSDASGKSKKSNLSSNTNSTPSSLIDEKTKLFPDSNSNRDSLPAYNYLFPEGQSNPEGNNNRLSKVPGTHTIGYDNPTFSTFTEGSKEQDPEVPITPTTPNYPPPPPLVPPKPKILKKRDSTQELHYVEEVTYNMAASPNGTISQAAKLTPRAPGATPAPRPPLGSSSSNMSSQSTTSC